MNRRATLSAAIIGAITASCGIDTNQKDDFEVKGRQQAERSENATAVEQDSSERDCSGIALHGSHLTCDDDDVTARDQELDDSKIPSPSENSEENSQPPGSVTPPPGDAADNQVPNETEPTPPPANPNLIEFRIKAGTGRGGWNTQATMIEVKVGQTIRFYNDDTTIHRLHTSGRPCPHGVNIPVGQYKDCVVTQTFDSTSSNAVYDHISGPSSKIWIKATN